LIRCPDCEKMFSDRIAACPQCGCPIEEAKKEMQKQMVMEVEPMIPEVPLPPPVVEKKKVVTERNYTDKEKARIAFAEALTKTMWCKGLITTEEKAKIDVITEAKITEK